MKENPNDVIEKVAGDIAKEAVDVLDTVDEGTEAAVEVASSSPYDIDAVLPHIGERRKGYMELKPCQSYLMRGYNRALPGAVTRLNVLTDKRGQWNFAGQTMEQIRKRFPQLAARMITKVNDQYVWNDKFLLRFAIEVPDTGMRLHFDNERERFFASIIHIFNEIGEQEEPQNHFQRFYVVDSVTEAQETTQKSKVTFDALEIIHKKMGPEQIRKTAVAFGSVYGQESTIEAQERLIHVANTEPDKFLEAYQNAERTNIIVDLRLMVQSHLVTVDHNKTYTYKDTILGVDEDQAVLYFLDPKNQQFYITLKQALKNKLLQDAV